MIEIAAQPYPLTLDPARTALLVIDMQRDFLVSWRLMEAAPMV